MTTAQIILLGIRVLKALKKKDPAIGKSISMAIADELDGTDEDKAVIEDIIGSVLEAIFK